MVYFKDACVCIVVSVVFLMFGTAFESSFFKELMESLLEVVCGIFAINIASTALIADLIQKISAKTGHQFENSKESLITELKIQAILILCIVLFMVLYYANFEKIHCPIIYDIREKIKYVSEVGILSIFFYFIWLTYDLGTALFEILKYKGNEPK